MYSILLSKCKDAVPQQCLLSRHCLGMLYYHAVLRKHQWYSSNSKINYNIFDGIIYVQYTYSIVNCLGGLK